MFGGRPGDAEPQRRDFLSSGTRAGRSGAGKRPAFERTYPSITRWATAYGWVEIGPTEMSASFVRALDIGGMVWEGEATYASVDAVLHALEAALGQLLHDQFGEP